MTSSTQQTLIAIDPGPDKSAWVLMRGMSVRSFAFEPNGDVLNMIQRRYEHSSLTVLLVIEDMKCYGGAAVGEPVLLTCKWMGRFEKANDMRFIEITNATIRSQICKSIKARDCHIRQALIDRYGGQDKAVGNKKNPGPLYGMKQNKHHWSALAVGVTFLEQRQEAAR